MAGSIVIGTGTRAGQGCTSFLCSLAWAAARDHRVLLADLDPAGGTIVDALNLEETAGGVTNLLYHRGQVSGQMIMDQVVQVRSRPRLSVLPGVRGHGLPPPESYLEPIVQGLRATQFELVVVDFGCPFVYPTLIATNSRVGEIACSLAREVLVVMKDDPALLPTSIEVLRSARLPFGRIVLSTQFRGRLNRSVAETLRPYVPNHPVAYHWSWDEPAYRSALLKGVPIPKPELADFLPITQWAREGGLGEEAS